MSDAPREEEIYQALEPGSSYRSGLSNPVAEIPMRFKGAMGGGAVGNEDYPDHEPRASVPYKHYKDLEDIDPKLHEAVTHVADEIHIPRTDLASLVYANSGYDASARNGMRTGYMGLTPDDARMLDPEGHLDINDPIDNLFMGAMKYKRISNRFGMGTPNAFAAYYGGGDRIHSLLGQDPDEHRRNAPDGTFEFLNKVLGRGGDGEGSGGGAPPTDEAGAGGDQGGVAGMAATAQQGAVPPMYPNEPVPAAQPAIRPAPVTSTGPVPSSDSSAGVAPMYPSVPAAPPPPVGPPAGPEPISQAIGNFFAPAPGAQQPFTLAPGAPPGYTPNRVIGSGPEIASIPPGQGVPGAEQLGDRADYPMAPPQRQEYQPPFTPVPLSPDDTGWQRPVPPAAPVDDTGWQRPAPTPVLTGAGGVLQPAPVQSTEDTRPTVTPPPPDTSGGYAVGGAIGRRVQEQVPDNYPGQPPTPQVQPTTGSGAPPSPRPTRAIGTDNMAADLNRQELARVQGGRPDVIPTGPTQAPAPPPEAAPAVQTATPTGSGATPTAAPGAGGDTAAPAANLPAGAPKALAPPGSTPTATAAPPIDRLQGNGGAMTPTSAVRAGAQGPDGVLTHIARNGPRGMSIGDGWDHFQDLLERAMIMKGDINGLQHAQEYVFRMKHKGAMENLMQAIGSMDDPETAVRFLAKSHAFVTDGTAIGFQVLNNQIYGQKYDEQTHDKIGKPFSVTEQGLRQLAIAHSDPSKFNAALNTERQTNETGRHNRKTEKHADEQLAQSERTSLRSLEEKQIEFKINQERYADAAKQRAAEHATATQQRQDLADQAEKRTRELQAERHAQQTSENEKNRQLREDQAEQRRVDAAEKEAQRRADAAEKAATRAAEERAGRQKYVEEATDEYFGRGGAEGTALDHNQKPYKGPDLTKARIIFGGMLHHDKTVSSPETAMDYTRGFLSGQYKMAESVGDDGKRYAHIRDQDGNVLATVPANVWRVYLPKQGTVSIGGKR